jgi:hypothetical protein
MDMRGFTSIAGQLEKETERLGITPERIRAAGIYIVNKVIQESSEKLSMTSRLHIGGDTWYFTFDEISDAII